MNYETNSQKRTSHPQTLTRNYYSQYITKTRKQVIFYCKTVLKLKKGDPEV